MEERPFRDKEAEPTDEKLKKAFGDLYVQYKELMDISDSFCRDWNFSKSSGWMLKVHDKRKALFYIIPLKNELKISMAIKENERKAFLGDSELETLHNMIKSAKKYREGYALRFNIKDDKDYKILEILIKKLIALRI